MAIPKHTSAVLDALDEMAREAFSAAARIESAVRARLTGNARPSRADLGGVEEIAVAAMTAAGSRIQGAGFVAAVGLLASERWWLEWFVREDDGRPNRLEVPTDPVAMGFHDYEPLAWYAVPRDTGRRHVTGPYVDSLCTEDYTLTFSQPVLVDGRFVGVAGADIGVRAAERTLLPVLRSSAKRLAVVNADGRTLASNTGTLVCGDLLDESQATGSHALHDLPLRVVRLG